MPATVHFSPALTSGRLLLGRSQVVTQPTGLVEVSVDYIARQADLPQVVNKFFLDAPPPIFPSRTISRRNLAEGQLFMVSYGVDQQYGVATINARYAGVTANPIKPYRTFDYIDFNTTARVSADPGGGFGSSSFVRRNFQTVAGGNEYLDFPFAFVPFTGRAERVRFTFAQLASAADAPIDAAPASGADTIVDSDVSGELRYAPEQRAFGLPRTVTDLSPAEPGDPTVAITETKLFGREVGEFLEAKNNITLNDLTVEEWAARDVVPGVSLRISRETRAITPSVYVREITYTPRPFNR